MRRELQSQNRVNGDYEKTTGPIYFKFWQKFLLMSTTEIQKKRILAAKLMVYGHLYFKTKMGVAGLMFEPHPPNFEKLYNF